MTTWRNDTSKLYLLPKHQSVYPMHSEAKQHQSVWSRERFTAGSRKETDGSSPPKPQTPCELSAKPFSREGEGGASMLLPTFWWQSLCSWGQVTVRERCSCKPPPSDYYSLFWQERTRSPGTTVTLWGPALAEIGQISAGGSLRARSPGPVQPPSLRKPGAQDATSAQAPQAACMAGEGRADPADADPGRRPLPWGCRCGGEGHLKAWAWPVGGTWWGLWSLQDTAPNLFPGPLSSSASRRPDELEGPWERARIRFVLHSPAWRPPLPDHLSSDPLLSWTANGRSLTVACLGEGPLWCQTNGWTGLLMVPRPLPPTQLPPSCQVTGWGRRCRVTQMIRWHWITYPVDNV